MNYFYAVMSETQGGAAVIGMSLKGPVPGYLSVHLYLPSPGLGKLLSMEPTGHLWS